MQPEEEGTRHSLVEIDRASVLDHEIAIGALPTQIIRDRVLVPFACRVCLSVSVYYIDCHLSSVLRGTSSLCKKKFVYSTLRRPRQSRNRPELLLFHLHDQTVRSGCTNHRSYPFTRTVHLFETSHAVIRRNVDQVLLRRTPRHDPFSLSTLSFPQTDKVYQCAARENCIGVGAHPCDAVRQPLPHYGVLW